MKKRRTDLVMDAELELKSEYVFADEVEDDPTFDARMLSAEEQQQRDDAALDYEHNILIPWIADKTRQAPCACFSQFARLKRRFDRNRVYGHDGVVNRDAKLSQDDIDSYKWGLLIRTENGYWKEVLFAMRTCRRCGRLEMFGDVSMMMQHFDQVYINGMNAAVSTSMKDLILEDVETGEITPADDILDGLLGGGEVK